MKIAVPITSENQINGHFGRSEAFNVFTVSDNNDISSIERVEAYNGSGCKSDIAIELAADGVTVMLAGGIGEGAVNKLTNNGIKVVRGCSGDASELVRLYISGLVVDQEPQCNHHHGHDHKHGHDHTHN